MSIPVQSPTGKAIRDSEDQQLQHTAKALDAIVRWSHYRFLGRVAELSAVQIDRSSISILNRLYVSGPCRVSALADYLGLDRSTVSRQVKNVERAGWVAKGPDGDDSRALRLVLTPSGRKTIVKVRGSFDDVVRELTDQLSAEERDGLARYLPSLAEVMDKQTSPFAAGIPPAASAPLQ